MIGPAILSAMIQISFISILLAKTLTFHLSTLVLVDILQNQIFNGECKIIRTEFMRSAEKQKYFDCLKLPGYPTLTSGDHAHPKPVNSAC